MVIFASVAAHLCVQEIKEEGNSEDADEALRTLSAILKVYGMAVAQKMGIKMPDLRSDPNVIIGLI